MADVSGARGTLNVGQSQRKVDMREEILLDEPNSAPLTVFSARLNKRPAHNTTIKWQEDALKSRIDAINNGAGYLAGDTSVVVDDGTKFAAQDIVKVTRTGELLRVTNVSTNTLTVVRSVGPTAAAALVDDDELFILGSARMEGDVSRAARSDNPDEVSNYLQIIRNEVEMTESQRHSAQFTKPHDWPYQLKKIRIEHLKDIELAFLLGEPSEDTSGAHARRTTGGALYFADENHTDASGQLTEAEFFGALMTPMRYGRQTKTLFASPLVAGVLNTFPRSKVVVNDNGSSTYGVNVSRFVSPFGAVNLVVHWLLGDSAEYSGTAIGLDLDAIAYRYLANQEFGSRDTALLMNRQAPDADTRKDEYLSEVALEFGTPKRHFVIDGVTS